MLDSQQIQGIWRLTVLISYIGVLVISMRRALWTFQQNRYKVDRYSEYLKQKIKYEAPSFFYYLLLAFPFIIMDYVIQSEYQFLVYCFFSIIYIFVMYYRETTIRSTLLLKWTMRFSRLVTVMLILQGVWIYFVLVYGRFALYGYGFLWCFVSSWILVYIAWVLLYPVEHLIQWYYMWDAKRILNSCKLPIVAITGSYGKTSCKYILNQLLSRRYYGLKTPKSFNTAMGIAATIRKQFKPFHEYFICEMGSDHTGEIATMMKFVQPMYGVVTSIGPQHLQTFGTMRNIVYEKMSLIEQLPNDGIAFLNGDNVYIKEYELQNSCKVVTFGWQEGVDYQISNYEMTTHGSKFEVKVKEEEFSFETSLYGRNHILNCTAMIAVAHTLGMSMKELRKNLKSLDAIEHRLEKKEIQGRICFDNSYSSNLESAKESLEVLSKQSGKRVLITPGFVDLAMEQEAMNLEFGCLIKECADVVILVGEYQTQAIKMGLLQHGFDESMIYVVDSTKQAIQQALMLTHVNDCILIENDLPEVYQDQRDRGK